ncbi:MAG: hypothetical protein ACM3KL_02955 [Alphaproteobacteria bacterium]
MNLEAINAVAQLIAAIGVIVSLFYLAAQIRQNTRSMRAVVVDSLAHSIVDLLGPQAQDPEQMRAFAGVIEDWDGATEADRFRRCRSSSLLSRFSRTRGFSNVRARSRRNNGKVGTLTYGSIFTDRV